MRPFLATLLGLPQDETPPDAIETHRLRFVNQKDGAIQVSLDRGKTWQLIGRVLRPATGVIEGYLAAEYAPVGSVAAIAVHGLRIRISDKDPTLSAPLVISIDPREYLTTQERFGGHVAGGAGIVADIPAGKSLFRELAPMVGNRVFVEDAVGNPVQIPTDFRPRGSGETIIIPVVIPKNRLVSVVFENQGGGKVTGTFQDGTTRLLTHVLKPVRGIGRFDGTTYTGVGQLNTAHTGVITVSTAPADNPDKEDENLRGGFQISPTWHNARTEEIGADMVMTVGTPGPRKRELEGQAPLFRDMIPLTGSAATLAEMQVDYSGRWEPLPLLRGRLLDAFTAAGMTRYYRQQGSTRTVSKGVTAFRLRFPDITPETIQGATRTAAEGYRQKRLQIARSGNVSLVTGQVTVNANPERLGDVSYVRLRIDGVPKAISNISPFLLTWDTRRVPDGDYLLETEGLDERGRVVCTTKRRVFVYNGRV
jgi:hypothetical protein